jgi:polyisoprenoid-binding protein YceI
MSSGSPLSAGVTVWDLDPSHTGVHFSVKHLVVATVRGEFARLRGTVTFDPRDLDRSRIEATIEAASINTRDAQRDAHLRSPDFLETEKYPTIEFRSTKIVRTGEERFDVSGDLTIHGVTRPVVLKVEAPAAELKDPFGNIKRGATATTKINRSDFGLVWNVALEAGGFVVGDEIKIEIDVEAIRRAEAAAA